MTARALTRPELSVLLAYAKLDLDAEVLAASLPDDPAFAIAAGGLFPAQGGGDIPAGSRPPSPEARNHQHRADQRHRQPGRHRSLCCAPARSRACPRRQVARGFVLADGAFGLSALKTRIDALDLKVAGRGADPAVCRHRRPVPPRHALVPGPCRRRTRPSPTPWRNIAPAWKPCASSYQMTPRRHRAGGRIDQGRRARTTWRATWCCWRRWRGAGRGAAGA